MENITDEQRTVLRITLPDEGIRYVNSGNYCVVANPYYATRYAPLDEAYPARKESQDKDKNWVESQFVDEAVIEYVPFLPAYEEYKKANPDEFSDY